MNFANFSRSATLTVLSLCLLGLGLVYFRAKKIQNYLMPKDPNKYISIRYQMESGKTYGDEEILFENLLRENLPSYKYNAVPDPIKYRLLIWIYGGKHLNKHENLFLLGRNGPCVLIRVSETIILLCMVLGSYMFHLMRQEPSNWGRASFGWPVITGITLLILICILIGKLISILTYISSTGMILHAEVCSEVMVTCRSRFTARLGVLIDTLKTCSILSHVYDIWDELRKTIDEEESLDARLQRDDLWYEYVEEGDEMMNERQLYQVMYNLGVRIEENAVKSWMNTFDVSQKGGLNIQEFHMLAVVLREILNDPLDSEAIKQLITLRWGSDGKIDQDYFSESIIKKHLQLTPWTTQEVQHLFTYITQDFNIKVITIDILIQGLVNIEKNTLSPLNQAVQKMKEDQHSLQDLTAEQIDIDQNMESRV